MLADTKAVRRVLNAFNVNAEWTDKSGGNKDKAVRIVIAVADEDKFAEVQQAFADIGYTNRVYFTGGMYLRVKTYLA